MMRVAPQARYGHGTAGTAAGRRDGTVVGGDVRPHNQPAVDLVNGIPEPLKATDRDGMAARMAPSLRPRARDPDKIPPRGRLVNSAE